MASAITDNLPVCVVTGGSGLIGAAVCKIFLCQNYQVVCVDRVANFATFSGRDTYAFVECDVRKPTQIREALKKCPRIDVLVNLVGIAEPRTGPVENLSLDKWNEYLQVNLTSFFLFTKFAVAKLKKSKGSIVNVSSTRSLMSEPDCEAYAAAKGGIVALSHASAVSLGPDIKVNCISPGWIDNPEKKFSTKEKSQHPAGRVGRPDDIAELCLFLASATKSGFIRGQNIVCDGGMIRKMIYV